MTDKKLHSTNLPVLTVEKTVSVLADGYCTLIEKGLPLKSLPSVMLWGAPGVGKSQSVRRLAEVIRQRTGKKTTVTDVRLLLFNPIDLRGIPTANADKTLAVWLKPQIFNMDESSSVVNILFLDEISAAPQSVQAAAYQITLDRTVGEHKLPENCIVIAAGNRVTDKSVAVKMPKALANRLAHIEIEDGFESWKKWAVQKGISDKVVGFLSFRRNYINTFDASSDSLAFATPRSWEMVSGVLEAFNGDLDRAYPLIAGLVGTGIALEMKSWAQVYRDLPSVEDIFDGKRVTVPEKTDALYALSASLTAYLAEHKRDFLRIGNAVRYSMRMPADFSAMMLRDFMYVEDGYKERLMRNVPEFTEWLRKRGVLLNGNI